MRTVVQIQVRIERQTKYGDYHDALYFTTDEFFNKDGSRKLTDPQIEAQAQQRVANYERNIEEARMRPPPPEPTDDETFGVLPEDYLAKLRAWMEKKTEKPKVIEPPDQPLKVKP